MVGSFNQRPSNGRPRVNIAPRSYTPVKPIAQPQQTLKGNILSQGLSNSGRGNLSRRSNTGAYIFNEYGTLRSDPRMSN
jgi:hypothetical protein